MERANMENYIQKTLDNRGVFFPVTIKNPKNPEREIARYLYAQYEIAGYRDIEILDTSETEDLVAVYCVHRGYEVMTYCFVCDLKRYQKISGDNLSLEEGEILAGVTLEQLPYIFIKSSWITRLLRIAHDPNEEDRMISSFRNTLKESLQKPLVL